MKILISYITGIGNTVMCIPALRKLRRALPEAEIDVMVRPRASKEILERIGCQNRVHVFNSTLQKGVFSKLRFLRQLRQNKYDINITAFPSNRAEFNLLSFMIGAKQRIAARYQVGHIETLDFLQTDLLDASEELHDIDQNLSLLAPLRIPNLLLDGKDISWDTHEDELVYADEWLHQNHITSNELLIGFHPGCNSAQGNYLKRWPIEYFAELGDRLVEAFGARILIFGDRSETALKEKIIGLMKTPAFLPENPSILKVAALIKHCRLFITNDSGLMHIAAAVQVPTVSLFGPSDLHRNAPHGESHTLIKSELSCAPCNKYPHYQFGGSYIRCIYHGEHKGKCMQTIDVDHVYKTIVQSYADIFSAPAAI